MSKEIEKLKQQVDTQSDLIQDIYERQKKFLHKLCELEEITGIRENKDEAKILNARIEKITGTNLFRETLSLIVNRGGKRYVLEAKASKDEVGICRPWIAVKELE